MSKPSPFGPSAEAQNSVSPAWWVPSLYLAEGLPYVMVNSVSVIIYKRLGIPNADIALYTSLFYLPWVIKPLWGPLVDLYWSKRKWTLIMQALMGLTFMGTALAFQGEDKMLWWTGTLLLFTATAFLSATHDIAADGFYMLGLNPTQQAAYVGIRSTFYRIANIIGLGVLVMSAGILESRTGRDVMPVAIQAGPAKSTMAAPAPLEMESDFIKVSPPSATVLASESTTLTVSLRDVPQTTVTLTINQVPSVWYKYMAKFGPEFLVKATPQGGKEILEFAPGTTQPLELVISADAKLKSPVSVRFDLVAANIPLTWGFILGGVGGFLLVVALLHTIVLPKPAEDSGTSTRVPFVQAAFWLGLAVIVPFALLVFVGNRLHDLSLRFMDPKLVSTWNEPMKFVVMVAMILFLIGIFQSVRVRALTGSLFGAASHRSGIGFAEVFITFFEKKGILSMLAFLLLYRLGDAMLVKMGPPFFLDALANGGLGLSQTDVGFVKGVCGVVGLMVGGILGGFCLAYGGLKKWLFPMAVLTNLPNVLYAYLAWNQPENIGVVIACVLTEEFFYGFGFSAYMFYMIYIAGTGERKTSHFALCTGFMALGMMLPGMISGILQATMGYPWFFTLVAGLSLLGVLVALIVPLDKNYGKKEQ